MTVSLFGWIDCITATVVVFSGIITSLLFVYLGSKREAPRLKQLGIIALMAGLMYLGVFLDFVFVLTTGRNLDNSWGATALLSYIWFGPLIILAIFLGTQMVMPKHVLKITIVYVIISVIFTILIFMDPFNSFYFGYPSNPKNPDVLIDYNVNSFSVAGILMGIMMVGVLIFLGIGILVKASQTTGDLRMRFLAIALGAFCYGIFGIFEGLTVPGIGVIFVRIGYISSFWFMYYGFR